MSGVLLATILALAAVAAVLGLIFVGVLKVPGYGKSASNGPFSVVFTETGLPSGKSWSAVVNGLPESSTTSNITFRENDGTYPFSTNASGYGGDPSAGSLVVRGSDVSVKVKFTAL